MERLNTLPRNKILKELQFFKKYHDHTQKEISDQFTNISDLRAELYKLEKKDKKDKGKKDENIKKNEKNEKKKDKKEKKKEENETIHLLFLQARADYPSWDNPYIIAARTKNELMIKFLKYMESLSDDEWEGMFDNKKEYISFIKKEFEKLELNSVEAPELDNAYLIMYKITNL